jgi:hypothetical protein
VQSSRRLEREACRNVEVMWLIGRLAPDHEIDRRFPEGQWRGDPEGLREVRCAMPADGPVADPERRD